MSEEKHSLRERLAPMLPKFLMILLILQPLMDILSFWTDRLGMSNTITLLLRFAVFAVVCVLGFVTSVAQEGLRHRHRRLCLPARRTLHLLLHRRLPAHRL